MTLRRLGLDPRDIPIVHVPGTDVGLAAAQHILTAIESREPIPGAVFIEGADMLVENPNEGRFVAPFMTWMQRIAEHYHIAIILSVGAPKSKPKEQHTLRRDRILGSEKWSRMAEDVVTIEYVGDGTGNERSMVVQHRNAKTERFDMVYTDDGRLIQTVRPQESDHPDRHVFAWMQTRSEFTKQELRDAFRWSGDKGAKVINGLVAAGVLQEHGTGKRATYSWDESAQATA